MRYKEIQHQKVFFNDTATTEIYALSLHDTLPIYIKLTDDGQADVKLKITDPEYAPLRRGTEAIVRLTSLSGVANRYIDLRLPGGNAPAIDDGGRIEEIGRAHV